MAIFAALVSAQLTAAQQPEEPKEAERGFRTLGWNLGAEDLFYESSGKEIPLQIHEYARSAYFKSPTDKIIIAYRKITDDEGKTIREIVAKANISKGGKTPLVIFSKDSKHEGKYQCATFADDANSFPPASYRFINLSTVDLKAGVDSKSVVVYSKGLALIKANSDKELPTRYVTITAMINGEPQRIYSNNWVLRPLQRTMVIISTVGGNAEVMRIVDIVRPL